MAPSGIVNSSPPRRTRPRPEIADQACRRTPWNCLRRRLLPLHSAPEPYMAREGCEHIDGRLDLPECSRRWLFLAFITRCRPTLIAKIKTSLIASVQTSTIV